MAQYTYCPKCDHDVEAVEVTMGTRGGGAVLRCAECGQVLADLSSKVKMEAIRDREKVNLARVVTAGYTGVQNDILIAALIRSRYTEVLDHYADGEQLLSSIASMLRRREPPKLIILEVNMPIMNGINAALCMRSIEKGIGREKVPILFFTQKPLDDMFSRAIKFLTPAKFVPLPANPDPETFRKRADQVADLLKGETW